MQHLDSSFTDRELDALLDAAGATPEGEVNYERFVDFLQIGSDQSAASNSSATRSQTQNPGSYSPLRIDSSNYTRLPQLAPMSASMPADANAALALIRAATEERNWLQKLVDEKRSERESLEARVIMLRQRNAVLQSSNDALLQRFDELSEKMDSAERALGASTSHYERLMWSGSMQSQTLQPYMTSSLLMQQPGRFEQQLQLQKQEEQWQQQQHQLQMQLQQMHMQQQMQQQQFQQQMQQAQIQQQMQQAQIQQQMQQAQFPQQMSVKPLVLAQQPSQQPSLSPSPPAAPGPSEEELQSLDRKGSKVSASGRRPSLLSACERSGVDSNTGDAQQSTARDDSPNPPQRGGPALSLRERRHQKPILGLSVTKESRKAEVTALQSAPKPAPVVQSQEPQAPEPINRSKPESKKAPASNAGTGDRGEPLSPLRKARPEWEGNTRTLQMEGAKDTKLFKMEDCPASPKSPKKRNQWKDSRTGSKEQRKGSKEPMSPLRKARPDWDGNRNTINMLNISSTKMSTLEGCPASPKSTKKRHKTWATGEVVSHSIIYEPLSPLRRSRPHWTGNQKVLEIQAAKGTKVVVMEDYPASPKSTRKKRNQWASKEVTSVSETRGRQMSKSGGRRTNEGANHNSNVDYNKQSSVATDIGPLTQAELDQLQIPAPVLVNASKNDCDN